MTDFDTLEGFRPFPKMARLAREMIITEKLDGTNAQILINDTGDKISAGSRTRMITPEDDNFGFARWVEANKEELLKLGPGRHFGEWWGQGIQRNYGLKEKRFSLFNVRRWGPTGENPPPACCHVVPVLYTGTFNSLDISITLDVLRVEGSKAVPGFMKPEGVVIFHTAGGYLFKKTFEKDDTGKGD